MAYKDIDPNIWKPENEGDEIEGVLVRVDNKSGKFESTIYHLETLNQEQKVIFGSTILDDRMSYINPGDRVKITYKGTTKNQRGQDVKIFKVSKWEDKPETQKI